MPHLRQVYVEGMTHEQRTFGGTPVTAVEELREIIPPPLGAAAGKVRPALHELDRQWLAASPL